MSIEMIQNGADPSDELLLTDVAEGGDAGEGADGAEGEPLDEPEYPETLDDELDPAQETPLIKQMREKAKEDARIKREQERRIAELEGKTAPQRTKEPDLWVDCEGDPDKYKDALLAWQDNERQVEAAAASQGSARQSQAQAWQAELQTYKANAVKLGKPDFDAAEAAVIGTLDAAQQSTIVMAAKDPARFIYALGRSPIRLAQLAEITNPIKLAAEVARIEGARIMPRKEPANIDTPLRGNARLSVQGEDKKEAALIKEVERTGDIDKLRAYRKEQRSKAA